MTEIYRADQRHAEEIKGLIYPGFFEESTFSGLTFDHEQTLKQVRSWIDDLCLIALDDGKIVGFTAAVGYRSFFKEAEMAVEIFYIAPSHRGTGTSRALVSALTEYADELGIASIQTSCLSGISDENNSLFVNLWGKSGFKKLGTVLIRSREHE